MLDSEKNPTDARSGWLTLILLRDYADRLWIEDDVIEKFDGAWRTWVQPVIAQGKAHPDLEKNWICFSLAFNYLSNEGFHLPICSKPWIAALRSFLAILGTECPTRLQIRRPSPWSNEMPVSDFPSPPVEFSEGEIEQVRTYLETIISKSEGFTLRKLVAAIVNEDWEAIPEDRSVVYRLCRAVANHEPFGTNTGSSASIQSLLIRANKDIRSENETTSMEQYRNARKRSIEVQLEILIRAISGKPGLQGMRCSIEELSGHFALPRSPGKSDILNPLRDNSTITLFPHRSNFPARLSKAEWLPNGERTLEPPDPLKLWIAYNWVNPNAPFWMMKAPAIYRFLKDTRLLTSNLDQEEARREAEQKRTLDTINSLKLPKLKPIQPILDFELNTQFFGGFRAEGLHALPQMPHLGSAQVSRATLGKLNGASPPARFHSSQGEAPITARDEVN